VHIPACFLFRSFEKDDLSWEFVKLYNFYFSLLLTLFQLLRGWPLPEPVRKAIEEKDLIVASVTSGNRNFEGRINPHVKANYLASPMLVVAYALAGRVDIDFLNEPLGRYKFGKEVLLRDIWPEAKEINAMIKKYIKSATFKRVYKNATQGSSDWAKVKAPQGDFYSWNEKSTYIQEPPYFLGMGDQLKAIKDIKDARVLVMVGDSITTDHISPAGFIGEDSPAGKFLLENGIEKSEFNSYGSRRGNDKTSYCS